LKEENMAKIERNKDPFKEALMPPVFRVQLVREKSGQRSGLDGPEAAAQILGRYLQHADREHFVSLMLDVKNQVIGIHTVSVGSLFVAIVSPREVFKAAILANAAAIIVAHNHPSGDVTPSPEDIQVTKTLKEAGKLLDIEVLDHLILGGDGKWASLKRLGHC
jgi:DNA repair protein RadC